MRYFDFADIHDFEELWIIHLDVAEERQIEAIV